ncbi:Protein FAM63A [Babesia microti strain RI]|uniref:Protein FAM63A n=1 Tax=Babesia microti (strain RI) TaxID=1133968 RepID=A0A1N6LX41_BABMR|nr:Protein FAM63A [Babesia microti strain RI]SIO73450.1 Protein FAM63A [Babesia microti strain RI]|eukprot:XP_021337547.1 Protein FAM63A [Babesia microti strain RI]
MVSFSVKYIEYFGDITPIVLQSDNGPCPFLALINILLLRHMISLPIDIKSVEFDYLCTTVIDILVESHTQLDIDQLKYTMLDMQRGIDVDCGFKNIYDITISSEIDIFKHFGINFVHGWVVSTYDTYYYPILYRFTYNKLMDQLVLYQTQGTTDGSNNESELSSEEVDIVNNFIKNYSSQLTEEGLIQLVTNLQENELAILFYNNHCTVVLKYNKELYCLVTDIGYRENSCVWEKLDNIYNDTSFYDDKFQKYTAEMDDIKLPSGGKGTKKIARSTWLSKVGKNTAKISSKTCNSPRSSGRRRSKCQLM